MSRYGKSQKTYETDESGTFETTGLTAEDVSGLIKIRADNRATIKSAIRQDISAALEEIGLVAEGYAKRKCPVDTGRLRNSITHVQHGDTVSIGTNVPYAAYVELGTSRQKAQPYLKPAANDHKKKYTDIARKYLQG